VSGPVRWHARWVLPVATPPIVDGTVVTEGERITWVGPRAQAPAGRDEELGDSILTPGLVNAHSHLDLTADDLRDAALLGVAEGLSRGITTFGDTADNAAPFDAMRTLGARGIAYREVFGPDPSQSAESLRGLEEAVRDMRARADARVRVGVSPHAPYSVSDALFRAVAEYASREGLPLAVHIAESAVEDDLVIRGAGPFAQFLRGRGIAVETRADGAIALLDADGLLRTGTLLIHCVRASASDIRRIADTGCGVAHCPASNAKLGHGIAPLQEFVAAGVRIGLGSDSMASNDAMDLLAEARLAVLQQRARLKRSDLFPARAALRLATMGGAEAMRLDGEIGSLVPGKQADLAAFRMDGVTGPVEDPFAALIFASSGARAHRVVVAGVERVRDGVVAGFDPSVAGRVAATAARLAQWRRSRSAG
jgi:cytosine/adenosine deaminase-related metal-dependent hydrolase